MDAICINQSDDQEKSWQVQQMSEIYSRAAKVLVFLGVADEVSDRAMEMFDLAGAAGMERGCWLNIAWLDDSFPRTLAQALVKGERLDYPADSMEELLAMIISNRFGLDIFPGDEVAALMERPYWHRAWIIQEIGLADRLSFICGTRKIVTGYRFLAAFRIFCTIMQVALDTRTIKSADSKLSALMEGAREEIYHCYEPPSLKIYQRAICGFNPLQYFGSILVDVGLQNMEATDPRDIVFALLGICHDRDTTQIQLDYSHSCKEIYTQATMALIRATSLQVLILSSGLKRQLGLPSWVPDYSTPFAMVLRRMQPWTGKYIMDTSYRQLPANPDILELDGFAIEHILVVAPRLDTDDTTLKDKAGQDDYIGDLNRMLQKYVREVEELLVTSVKHEKDIQLQRNYLAFAIAGMGLLAIASGISDSELYSLFTIAKDKIEWSESLPSSHPLNIVAAINDIYSGGNLDYMSELTSLFEELCDIEGSVVLETGDEHPLVKFEDFLNTVGENEDINQLKESLRKKLTHAEAKVSSSLVTLGHINNAMNENVPFLTENGLIGIGPEKMEVGDLLVRFQGAPHNFLLRAREQERHELIGEAFVPEVFYCEGTECELPKSTFWLC